MESWVKSTQGKLVLGFIGVMILLYVVFIGGSGESAGVDAGAGAGAGFGEEGADDFAAANSNSDQIAAGRTGETESMPITALQPEPQSQYAVVIDAGSSGSRVHVYEVQQTDQGAYVVVDELFEALKPGLSAYKHDPAAAAASLDSLLEKAKARVPASVHARTPIALGATAGLRMIGEKLSTRILDAVRVRIGDLTDFRLRQDLDVRILRGIDEGKYAWIAVNTLLGQIGQAPEHTFAACDLGGGSVQCMFALSALHLRQGHKPKNYVESVKGGGMTYDLYVHSFLGYGLLAARLAVLKIAPDAAQACMPGDFHEDYVYGEESVSASGSGAASFNRCRTAVHAALHSEEPCTDASDDEPDDSQCEIAGQWNGGLGQVLSESPKFKLHLMSFFFERTKSVGAGTVGKQLDEGEDESSVTKLRQHGRLACSQSMAQLAQDATIHLDYAVDIPYLCLDISYIYTFLVDGIGVHKDSPFVIEKKIDNANGKSFEAAWALGMAMEILSS